MRMQYPLVAKPKKLLLKMQKPLAVNIMVQICTLSCPLIMSITVRKKKEEATNGLNFSTQTHDATSSDTTNITKFWTIMDQGEQRIVIKTNSTSIKTSRCQLHNTCTHV